MTLSLDLDVIDGFRATARNIANYLYNADFAGNYFRQDALNANLPAYEIGDALKCFCTSEHATILFMDIQPIDILSIEVGAPIRFNEHETDVSLKTWHNAGATPLPQSWNVEEEEKVTEARDILTEISTAIRAKVGGKSPVFEASLEAELSAKLGINLKRQEERRLLKQEKMDLEVPKWTSTSLIQRHTIADVRQIIKMHCLVDAQVSFISQGDEPRWAKHFESLHQMQTYLRGGGGGTDENADALNRVVNTRQFQNFAIEKAHLEFEIVQERISRNVKTGEVTRKDTPIENPNRRKRRRRQKRQDR